MNTTTNENGISREERICSMIADEDKRADTFYLHQGLAFSMDLADAYINAHNFENAGMTPTAVATFAMARLEWVLQEGRGALNDVISVDDFNVLCNAFNAEFVVPFDFASLATAVADDYGLEMDTYKASPMGPLIDKLMKLSVLQRIALRDLVERFWYQGQHEFDSFEAFLNANGVKPTEQ